MQREDLFMYIKAKQSSVIVFTVDKTPKVLDWTFITSAANKSRWQKLVQLLQIQSSTSAMSLISKMNKHPKQLWEFIDE